MMTEPLVAVAGLCAGYAPGRYALSETTFTVAGGAVVAVLGPNGGGKTTLMRALLDEVPVRQGSVVLEGPSYVPQGDRSRLDLPVSASDVALMGAFGRTRWFRRVARKERARALDALDRVGLAALADHPYGKLSGGQRQRALIARALVQDARVMLLDEPFSGVDRPSAELVERLLDDLRGESRAMLVATHDVAYARTCDAVLCLNGRQIAFGPPQTALTLEALEQTYGGRVMRVGGAEVLSLDQQRTS